MFYPNDVASKFILYLSMYHVVKGYISEYSNFNISCVMVYYWGDTFSIISLSLKHNVFEDDCASLIRWNTYISRASFQSIVHV